MNTRTKPVPERFQRTSTDGTSTIRFVVLPAVVQGLQDAALDLVPLLDNVWYWHHVVLQALIAPGEPPLTHCEIQFYQLYARSISTQHRLAIVDGSVFDKSRVLVPHGTVHLNDSTQLSYRLLKLS